MSPYISIPIAAVAVWATDGPRLLLQGGADLPHPDVGLPGLSDRRVPGPSRRQGGPQQPAVAALPPHARVPRSSRWRSSAPPSRPTCSSTWPRPSSTRGSSPSDYRKERIDTVSGAIWSDIISIFIIIATAAAIGGTGPLQSARQAAEALEPVVGPAAPALFGLGLLGASLLAASVVPLSTSYADRRRHRRAPVGLRQLPAGPPLLRAVHPADRRRRGGGAGPGQPRVTRRQRPGAQRHHHADAARPTSSSWPTARASSGSARNGPIFKVVATLCVSVVGVLSFVVLDPDRGRALVSRRAA